MKELDESKHYNNVDLVRIINQLIRQINLCGGLTSQDTKES